MKEVRSHWLNRTSNTPAIPNRPQTGTIRVTKLDKDTGATAQGDAVLTGAIFEIYASDKITLLDTLYCGTASAATQYQPIYAPAGVSGAVFQVIAAEDVKTPDGTVRYTKGTVVDTLTTNAAGKAESKQLYLGNYELRETKTVEPFVLNPGPHYVSLVYENQETAVVSSPITIHNIRQEISISCRN